MSEALASLVDDALDLVPARGRALLGLTGAPGAGKSTLARWLVCAIDARTAPGTAGYLPMDGFHLSNAQLERLGRLDRKGAPDTFDAHGYAALLRRVLVETDHPVYVPDYDRDLHEPVAARHVIGPGTRLIVTEGNYLARPVDPWESLRPLFAELWYVEADDALREERLLRRQRAGGRDEAAARAWVERSDRANGELVKRSRGGSTRIVPTGLVPRHRGAPKAR